MKTGVRQRKNITIEYRFAEGKLTACLSLRRSWLLEGGLRKGSGTGGQESYDWHSHCDDEIPDPVAAGMVTSLARPGRNVTGLSSLTSERTQSPSFPELEFYGKREAPDQQTSH